MVLPERTIGLCKSIRHFRHTHTQKETLSISLMQFETVRQYSRGLSAVLPRIKMQFRSGCNFLVLHPQPTKKIRDCRTLSIDLISLLTKPADSELRGTFLK